MIRKTSIGVKIIINNSHAAEQTMPTYKRKKKRKLERLSKMSN
jgi:hypothetical protein